MTSICVAQDQSWKWECADARVGAFSTLVDGMLIGMAELCVFIFGEHETKSLG